MFHKIQSVTPRSALVLLVEFQDGSTREYDVKPLLKKWPVFQMLDYVPGLFAQVRVDAGGYGVSWNDDIDLACDELYHNGVPVFAEENRASGPASSSVTLSQGGGNQNAGEG